MWLVVSTLSFLVLVLGIVVFFMVKAALKRAEELINYDAETDLINEYIEEVHQTLTKVYDALEKISQYPTVSNEPIVTQLILLIKQSKNDIQSILDRINNDT